MKKKQQNQTGFIPLLILMFLVLVLTIGFVFMRVINN